MLGLIAQGRSNAAIANALVLVNKTVERHITNILTKLDLPLTDENHRRVLMVLVWLDDGTP